MENNKIDVCIIGAGVIGLAIAEKLSYYFDNIIVLEKEKTFGQHISSRNSEVIHSGFYYPSKSLKATLCVKGNQLMYDFVNKYKIRHKKCGKLIVSNDIKELKKLEQQTISNNVDCKVLNQEETQMKEPQIKPHNALWIPSSGIVDSHGLMAKLEYLSIKNGVMMLYNYLVNKITKNKDYYELNIGRDETIQSKIVINAAGLWAHHISSMLGLSDYDISFYKGDYYKCNSLKNLNCLVYPIPKTKSLGIHTVLSLNGDVSFGPNIYPVNKIDYTISDKYKSEYLKQIKSFLNVEDIEIYPDFSGIRPKFKFINNFNDFIIRDEKHHGCKNFINLIGIDSPGLTSSLAIAEYVLSLISKK